MSRLKGQNYILRKDGWGKQKRRKTFQVITYLLVIRAAVTRNAKALQDKQDAKEFA